ncbi:MAG: UDP-4-amino-4,6-dideoxy-N-acetyl-beta-L-altrosamine transaminase [Desulfobacteraceae bacterium 4484_190.2]|nr:MAG: UDP-4-amino-4,6-dideoxy-N-acetyl-beta-L-altrosamine transaminase [Desulfobacteraceae bacterium 4484_190.2]
MKQDDFIPYGRQSIDEEDIRAVVSVLKSDWLTQGPAVEQFEKEFAAYCGARHAVAVSSGTAALHLAAIAAGFAQGDQVITTPITFVATANSIVYTGAEPVFVDVEPETACIDAGLIRQNISGSTRGIIPVHFAGQPCDMETIYSIANENDLVIIEDAAHAMGAEYRVKRRWYRVGACAHSDMTIFSLHPVKHIAAGEGGVITTNRESLAEQLRMLRSHGITRDVSRMSSNHGPWWYEMQSLGYNYRLTDIQSALAKSQLKKLDNFVTRRRKIARMYDEAFSQEPMIAPLVQKPGTRSSFHIYVLLCRRLDRKEFFQRLRTRDIGVNVHYIPIYQQPYYRRRYSVLPDNFPCSESYYNNAITIPLYPSMSDMQVKKVIDIVLSAVRDMVS